jgi:serine/threonine protein phosphatase PrpC
MTELTAHAHTDTGLVRAVNEDSHLVREGLYVVADGMGGHERGDVASRTAIDTLRSELPEESWPGPDDWPSPDDVMAAIIAANRAVAALSDGQGGRISGTTLAGVALVIPSGAAAAHWMAFNVGDSRVYAWDGVHLEQVTTDHSVVQELIDAGLITHRASLTHPDRSVITRALGANQELDVDVWLFPMRPGRSYVVCTDGITKELDEEAIARVLAAHRPGSSSPAEELVAAAIAAGGRDNATAVVVEFDAEHADDETAERPLTSITEDTIPRLR